MSNQLPKPKAKVTLSKTSKRRAATILDAHQRGAYIRMMMDAENTAFMSKFTRVNKDRHNDSN